jgi:glucose-6-phosphate 1-epimerase
MFTSANSRGDNDQLESSLMHDEMRPERSEIDALNSRFGIPGLVEVVSGNGGLPMVKVTTHLATAEIYLHGAQITAWRPGGHDQVLFLSEQTRWEDGRAIRGGIPICFPWFRSKANDAQAPAHGVVRTVRKTARRS